MVLADMGGGGQPAPGASLDNLLSQKPKFGNPFSNYQTSQQADAWSTYSHQIDTRQTISGITQSMLPSLQRQLDEMRKRAEEARRRAAELKAREEAAALAARQKEEAAAREERANQQLQAKQAAWDVTAARSPELMNRGDTAEVKRAAALELFRAVEARLAPKVTQTPSSPEEGLARFRAIEARVKPFQLPDAAKNTLDKLLSGEIDESTVSPRMQNWLINIRKDPLQQYNLAQNKPDVNELVNISVGWAKAHPTASWSLDDLTSRNVDRLTTSVLERNPEISRTDAAQYAQSAVDEAVKQQTEILSLQWSKGGLLGSIDQKRLDGQITISFAYQEQLRTIYDEMNAKIPAGQQRWEYDVPPPVGAVDEAWRRLSVQYGADYLNNLFTRPQDLAGKITAAVNPLRALNVSAGSVLKLMALTTPAGQAASLGSWLIDKYGPDQAKDMLNLAHLPQEAVQGQLDKVTLASTLNAAMTAPIFPTFNPNTMRPTTVSFGQVYAGGEVVSAPAARAIVRTAMTGSPLPPGEFQTEWVNGQVRLKLTPAGQKIYSKPEDFGPVGNIAVDVLTQSLNPANIVVAIPFAGPGIRMMQEGRVVAGLAEITAQLLGPTGLEAGIARSALRGLDSFARLGPEAMKALPKKVLDNQLFRRGVQNILEYSRSEMGSFRLGRANELADKARAADLLLAGEKVPGELTAHVEDLQAQVRRMVAEEQRTGIRIGPAAAPATGDLPVYNQYVRATRDMAQRDAGLSASELYPEVQAQVRAYSERTGKSANDLFEEVQRTREVPPDMLAAVTLSPHERALLKIRDDLQTQITGLGRGETGGGRLSGLKPGDEVVIRSTGETGTVHDVMANGDVRVLTGPPVDKVRGIVGQKATVVQGQGLDLLSYVSPNERAAVKAFSTSHIYGNGSSVVLPDGRFINIGGPQTHDKLASILPQAEGRTSSVYKTMDAEGWLRVDSFSPKEVVIDLYREPTWAQRVTIAQLANEYPKATIHVISDIPGASRWIETTGPGTALRFLDNVKLDPPAGWRESGRSSSGLTADEVAKNKAAYAKAQEDARARMITIQAAVEPPVAPLDMGAQKLMEAIDKAPVKRVGKPIMAGDAVITPTGTRGQVRTVTKNGKAAQVDIIAQDGTVHTVRQSIDSLSPYKTRVTPKKPLTGEDIKQTYEGVFPGRFGGGRPPIKPPAPPAPGSPEEGAWWLDKYRVDTAGGALKNYRDQVAERDLIVKAIQDAEQKAVTAGLPSSAEAEALRTRLNSLEQAVVESGKEIRLTGDELAAQREYEANVRAAMKPVDGVVTVPSLAPYNHQLYRPKRGEVDPIGEALTRLAGEPERAIPIVNREDFPTLQEFIDQVDNAKQNMLTARERVRYVEKDVKNGYSSEAKLAGARRDLEKSTNALAKAQKAQKGADKFVTLEDIETRANDALDRLAPGWRDGAQYEKVNTGRFSKEAKELDKTTPGWRSQRELYVATTQTKAMLRQGLEDGLDLIDYENLADAGLARRVSARIQEVIEGNVAGPVGQIAMQTNIIHSALRMATREHIDTLARRLDKELTRAKLGGLRLNADGQKIVRKLTDTQRATLSTGHNLDKLVVERPELFENITSELRRALDDVQAFQSSRIAIAQSFGYKIGIMERPYLEQLWRMNKDELEAAISMGLPGRVSVARQRKFGDMLEGIKSGFVPREDLSAGDLVRHAASQVDEAIASTYERREILKLPGVHYGGADVTKGEKVFSDPMYAGWSGPSLTVNQIRRLHDPNVNRLIYNYHNFASAFKNTVFGTMDMGVLGVQVAHTLGFGSPQILMSAINRSLSMFNLPHVHIYFNGDLSHAMEAALAGVHEGIGPSAVTLGSGTVVKYTPVIGKPLDKVIGALVDKATEVQFGMMLTPLRNMVYEGNLMAFKLIGRDVTDPVVKRLAANGANALAGGSRGAMLKGRHAAESTLLTSFQMTRSEMATFTQVAKLAFPPVPRFISKKISVLTPLTNVSFTQRYLALMTLGSLAATVYGISYALHTAFPSIVPEIGTLNPLDSHFASINVRIPGQRPLWVPLIPARGLIRAMGKSVAALNGDQIAYHALAGDPDLILADIQSANPAALDNIWIQFTGSKLAPAVQPFPALTGVGFDPATGYHIGDLPWKTRLLSLAPLPPLPKQLITDNEFDLISPEAATMFTGWNPFPMSPRELLDENVASWALMNDGKDDAGNLITKFKDLNFAQKDRYLRSSGGGGPGSNDPKILVQKVDKQQRQQHDEWQQLQDFQTSNTASKEREIANMAVQIDWGRPGGAALYKSQVSLINSKYSDNFGQQAKAMNINLEDLPEADNNDDALRSQIFDLDPIDLRFRKPDNRIDWDAYNKAKEDIISKMSTDAQAVMHQKKPYADPRINEVITRKDRAAEDLQKWMDAPKYNGMTIDEGKQLDSMLDALKRLSAFIELRTGKNISVSKLATNLFKQGKGNKKIMSYAIIASHSKLRPFIMDTTKQKLVLANPDLAVFYDFTYFDAPLDIQNEWMAQYSLRSRASIFPGQSLVPYTSSEITNPVDSEGRPVDAWGNPIDTSQ